MAYFRALERQGKHGFPLLSSYRFVTPSIFLTNISSSSPARTHVNKIPQLAALFHLPNTLAENGMAPNVLNGAIFNEAFLGSLLGGFGVAAVIELKTLADGQQRTMGGGVKLAEVERELGRKYEPGNLGFDPLGLGGKDEAAKKRMQLAEIKHCRLAMIAVSAFVFQELASGLPVTAETPYLFKPFFL